jgi:hypothetical protein
LKAIISTATNLDGYIQGMCKKHVIGFNSTGPQLRPNDLRIYDMVERSTGSTTPTIFCIIDIRPDQPNLPVTAYKASNLF